MCDLSGRQGQKTVDRVASVEFLSHVPVIHLNIIISK